ncbi:Lpg1974 family pore-forming outer membrane protein [Legionella sp. PL877]|uniref:Lpg1974 family pore-forming outer membrane protein n=1 Tax=Legionella sp. PL877 TaxID=3046773 RepID=UPI0024B750B8|nr:Lpg1974 family pore-forming outer membrane protein [Legionella sp. PL877]MDI9819231.1 Lpg1974 family pore-forming outer membrane protein [Legionella sp. PL877]
MTGFKQTVIATLLLGSGCGFAGTMGPVCAPGNVTVPCESTAWDFGIQALYLKSLYNNNDLSAYNIGSASGTRIFEALNYDFEWGFRVEGSYHFGTGSDLNLNWTHWRDDNSLRLAPPAARAAVDLTASLLTRLYADAKLDAVNLEWGQHVDFGEHKNIRFHAGLQYAALGTHLTLERTTSGATGFLADSNGTVAITDKFEQNALGPRVGADLSYDFNSGFSLYGNVAAALLVGQNRYSNNAPVNALNRPVHSSYTSLVPELEAKLGGKYTWGMGQGNLTVDAGYMVVNYFNAFHQSDLLLDTIQRIRNDIDFGLHGPYAGVKWVGNI